MTASVRRAYADGPFGQIHYRIARPEKPSARPALFCLHQTPKSGRDYAALMTHLGRDRVVVAPDTPGYGDSDPPPSPPSIEEYADAMLALIAALQDGGDVMPGAIDLMGYHTGGVIAARLAHRHPDRVRRIVFVSLAALDAKARESRLAHMHRFPVPREDSSNIAELWRLTETLNDPRLPVEWRHTALAECLRSGSRMPWGFRAVYEHDGISDLEALSQPALILCPRDDLWEVTRANAALLPRARLVAFDRAGNGFLDLDTAAVATLVTAFLDG